MVMNILVIIAHPDDEVLGMGGTILKHSTQGDIVTIAYLTTGIAARRSTNFRNATNYKITKKDKLEMKNQIRKLRKDAEKSCKILKVSKNVFFDLPDNEMDSVSSLEINKIIEKLVKENKPYRIYTSHYGDLNIDHKIVSEAVLSTCCTSKSDVKEIMCFEILSSTEWTFPYKFEPNYFINIKKELMQKMKAMQAYKNEIRKFPHPRSVESIENNARKWGTVSGFYAAEAFQIIKKLER